MADKLDQVAIRMIEQPPLYSDSPMDSPEAAIRVMQEFLRQMDRELFCIVNLQADLKPINMNVVSVGALDHAVTHPREVYKSAILSNAVGILMIHNHPSGSLTPSKADIAVTDRLRQAGAILGIQVYDHIITGRGHEFYSFMKQNLLRGERPVYAGSMDQIAPDGQMAAEQDAVMEQPITSYGKKENTATVPLPVPGKDIDSILKSLETGVSDLFTSERYEEYLKTMAKFHNYSFNNTLLIAMQRPDATLVTGYRNWQSMGRQVMKGEKGITIIAPAPVKKKQKQEVLDRDHRPVLDENGVPVLKEVEIKIPRFKAITVFDIAQTTGEPIELLAPQELQEAVRDYDFILQALKDISPVPIRFDEIEGTSKGYYHNIKKEIVIRKEMSESQTLKTVIHESAHAKLHDKEHMEKTGEKKDQLTREVEAESVAYCVCSALGLDTSDYSFPYIAGWSSGKDMKELKTSMDTIRRTAGEMIDELSEKIRERNAERKKELEEEQKKELIPAMEAAGYRFQEKEGQMLFVPDGVHEISGPLYAKSWEDVRNWLDAAIRKEPLDRERIERVLYPERFDKTSEEMMFQMTGTRFAIYQIPEDSRGASYQFMGTEERRKQGTEVNASDYECVYSAQMLPSDDLPTLYSMFQENVPADFKSRSLAVSDVVVTNRGGEMHAYYVDRFGFEELPEFVSQRQGILGITKEDPGIDVLDDSKCISFYAAECEEFPILGEVYTDLKLEDAFAKYDQIPENRMNGIKCIGFDLQDGSDWSGMFTLVSGDKIDKELINSIPGFRENRLVQEAVSRAERILEKRKRDREHTPAEKKEEMGKEKEQKRHRRREENSL